MGGKGEVVDGTVVISADAVLSKAERRCAIPRW